MSGRLLAFMLPWPPSVNRYWRHPNKGPLAGRNLISREGREYRKQVSESLLNQGVPAYSLSGRLAIEVVAFPPDKRKRDLSNLWKAFLDALQACGVVKDDGDFDDERIKRGKVSPGGALYVVVREL